MAGRCRACNKILGTHSDPELCDECMTIVWEYNASLIYKIDSEQPMYEYEDGKNE